MLVLLLLVIVYSLPVYQREISALLGHIGLSSLKTPIGELTFTEHSRLQGAVVSAAKPSGEERSSALPRPSYPRPGLDSLSHAVSAGVDDYLFKDARYIAFFNGRDDLRPDEDPAKDLRPGEDPAQDVIVATRTFLRPAKTLAQCPLKYVDIIPDSQLLLVDVRPVLYFFFRTHANAGAALRKNEDRPKDVDKDFLNFNNHVKESIESVLNALGATEADQPALAKTGEARNPDFAKECRMDKLELSAVSAESANDLKAFTYLQPYVTIALANLLVAHGSSDAAIDVITQWLYQWRCARGEGTGEKKTPAAKCKFGPIEAASKLPSGFASALNSS